MLVDNVLPGDASFTKQGSFLFQEYTEGNLSILSNQDSWGLPSMFKRGIQCPCLENLILGFIFVSRIDKLE